MASLSISPPLNLLNSIHFKPRNPSVSPKLKTTHFPEIDKRFCFTEFSSLSRNGQIQEAVHLLCQIPNNAGQIGPEFYVELLQGCANETELFLSQQIHGLIIKKGDVFARNEYIQTRLVVCYAKCDELECTYRMFSRLVVKNIFSWTAIIGLNSRMKLNEQALLCYSEILENGICPDNFVIPNALKACGANQWLGFGRGIHGYVIKMSFEGCVYVASSLVDMYGKCGVLEDAKVVFDEMSERNSVVWNSMIVGYVQNGMCEEAIRLFDEMRVEGVEPTRVTVSSFLSAAANLGAVEEGRQGHALAVLYGLELGNVMGSSLINFYSKIGWVEDASLVFSGMVEKDAVTWNLLISCYVQHGLAEDAVNMCHFMRLQGLRIDCVTMASLFSACSDIGDIKLGREGHCYCIRNNLDSDMVVATSMVNMYAKSKEIDYARRVFDSSLEKDLVLWNALLAAYAELGLSGKALELFYQMQLQGLQPNVITWNSILLALLRNRLVDEAKNMFSQMCAFSVEPNVVTWTTLIRGLAQNGVAFEAMLYFQQMQESGVQPNSMSLTGVLSACIDMTSLILGKSIHGYVIRRNHEFSTEILTSLADMYAKCGGIANARKVFNITSKG
ncbi:hypothetical protein SOVF_160020 [Spinacia oleracea]|uniref:Pentatricopeptide repeat-containing protein At5g55740, chloroplastic n=1 Tax=Spinacia oleracea TaxID=3562 RepID=A0A9R0KCW0_SPIOL|nr:pentatricopeptide repeat-containing protein At5g55740, chloroplastic [Spinacia oleracea]KNA08736.1 hypothetical protein SOVF_160020 [Spinacia oleracea]